MSEPAIEAFAAEFAAHAERLPGPVDARRDAWNLFAENGFPTPRQENWRFANLKAIRDTAWQTAESIAEQKAPLPELALAASQRLILRDGLVDPASSTGGGEAGVKLESLAIALSEAPLSGLDTLADPKEHGLLALNRALFRDGALLTIAPDTSIEDPLHLIHLWGDTGKARSVQARNVIRVGAGSRVVLIEHLSSASGDRGSQPSFANLVSEIELEPNASLDLVTLQRAGSGDQLVTSAHVRQAEGSRFSAHSLALGSAMHRSEIRVELAGENAHCELNGIYLGRDQQRLDHYTTIDHVSPHTTSDELYKGILGDRSHGVFHGRIHVRPHAQKIEALQHNANLLLSDRARVNTKPQLEIYADDVRCTHGATIGKLDPDHIFFLRSRGIPESEAMALLTYGFASEVLDRLPVSTLAEQVRLELARWLGGTRA